MNGRNRRAVALGLAVIAVAWLGLRGIPDAVRRLRLGEERVVQQAELLERAESRVGTLPLLADSIEAYTRIAEALPRLLLVGPDAATASVDLMERVRRQFQGAPATLLGFGPGPAQRSSGPLTLVSLVVRVETDFTGLIELVRHLETDSSLSIDAVGVQAVDPDGTAEMERLRVEISVGGWFHSSPEEAGAMGARGTES